MWDERYSSREYVYGKEPSGFLAAQEPDLPRGSALCLCAGEGRNAVFLAEKGFRVLAVDLSQVGLQKAMALAAERSVEIECLVTDLAEFSIEPDTWDLIVSVFCHFPSTLRRSIHREVTLGLRPGGAFVLEAYTPDQLAYGTGGPQSAELMMNLDQLRTELAGLHLTHGLETVRDVREGQFHTGRAAVVQVVARKQ